MTALSQLPVAPTRPALGSLKARVGIHCGSVATTVIGKHRPRFCVLGETVTISKRLQRSAQSQQVCLSWLAATMLQTQCSSRGLHLDRQLESRGECVIKGEWRCFCSRMA
eukprot:m.21289 g.21289  ORF g.21289 m.21289 type:complete len:110 (-) comp11121_c0_seq1:535-864(-)